MTQNVRFNAVSLIRGLGLDQQFVSAEWQQADDTIRMIRDDHKCKPGLSTLLWRILTDKQKKAPSTKDLNIKSETTQHCWAVASRMEGPGSEVIVDSGAGSVLTGWRERS